MSVHNNKAPYFPSRKNMVLTIVRAAQNQRGSKRANTIRQATDALELAEQGLYPYQYSFYFDDHHNERRTGPMEGVVWARDEKHALQFVGVDSNGGVYGYERVVIALAFRKTRIAKVKPRSEDFL